MTWLHDYRPYRRLMLALMRRYLAWAGGATRNGTKDGGYIVRMSADDYHRYTVLAARLSDQEFGKRIRLLRDGGCNV